MNLGSFQLPFFWGKKGSNGIVPRRGGKADASKKQCYSEAVMPLSVKREVGFAMLSTLENDARRVRPHHGAIPSKLNFLAALQSKDFHFTEVTTETGLFFVNKSAHADLRPTAEKEAAKYHYLLVFAVTFELMPGTTHIFQDTLRPRLYNSDGKLVKRMDECYWSDQTIPVELEIFIGALAETIRMELRTILRRIEQLK
ncbi:MAG: hypothetical protein ACLQVD_16300 [Capsulimonadaceae bacterium]